MARSRISLGREPSVPAIRRCTSLQDDPRVCFRADTLVAMRLMRRSVCTNLCFPHIEGMSGG